MPCNTGWKFETRPPVPTTRQSEQPSRPWGVGGVPASEQPSSRILVPSSLENHAGQQEATNVKRSLPVTQHGASFCVEEHGCGNHGNGNDPEGNHNAVGLSQSLGNPDQRAPAMHQGDGGWERQPRHQGSDTSGHQTCTRATEPRSDNQGTKSRAPAGTRDRVSGRRMQNATVQNLYL